AYQHCLRNDENLRDILASFHISCDKVNASGVSSLKSTDYNKQLYSVGRQSYAGRLPHKEAVEVPYSIAGLGTIYFRPLWGWDTGAYSTYKVLAGHNDYNVPFFMLFNCGNLVIIGKPPTPTVTTTAPKPNPQIVNKTTIPGRPAAGSEVKPGDLIGYRIYFRNAGNAAATNVFIEDSTPRQTSFVSQGSGAADRYSYIDSVYPGHSQEPHVYWVYNNFPAGAIGYYVDFTVRVNSGVSNGEQICNTAFIRSNQTPQTPSNKICHTVKITNPTQTITPPSTIPPPTIIVPPTPTKPCAEAANETDAIACLILSKNARNVSAEIANANNTTAKAGDIILYTLSVYNSGKIDVKDYVIQENIGDVLEYADKKDLHGATIDSHNNVVWPKTDIKAGQTVQKTLTVTVKNPIPTTNTPSSNPGSYDCVMTNVYKDTINIKVPCSIIKTVEKTTTTTLPNTGPGESLAAGFGITAVVGYFFARSRLMAEELEIVKEEYGTSGSY
ncbi:MAG TPA: DUF11 domain-containing protein, partial [Patescibacteria group bacterium]|nr:DUF11 domain-containing protein [Patescibacteria group bacterium]